MTQVDTFVDEGEHPSPGTAGKSSSNDGQNKHQNHSPHPPSSSSSSGGLGGVGGQKTIKIYQNGHPSSDQPLSLTMDKKQGHPWPQVLQMLHQAVNVPVQKVFTVQGKRVSSWTEVQRLEEVVVCGNEHFKMLPYGKETSNTSSNGKGAKMGRMMRDNKTPPKSRGKDYPGDKGGLAKSVTGSSGGGGDENEDRSPHHHHKRSSSNNYPNHIVKTLSEQDVSAMEISSKIRIRQSSPKPRPVSAYQHVNMTSSADRRSLGIGMSRIPVPKRITPTVSTSTYTSPQSPASNTNNSSNGTPIIPATTQVRTRKIFGEKTGTCNDSGSKQDSSKNPFIRPRLVTVIRHGMKPRKAVRFLLNKKTARSYDQVLNELTESIKPDWGAVRKVYTMSGSDVTCLEDFFGEDDIFLACANDRIGTNDFDLDTEECKSIQPYCKASLSVKQSRFKNLEPSRSPHRRPKSSSNSQSQQPLHHSHPKYIPLAHFPTAILEKYYVGNIIGDGNFAVVRECTDRTTKDKFALKIIDKAKCQGRDAPPEHEVKILSMVRHGNIVEMFEQFDYANELYIVLELVEGGDLFDAIAAVTKFPETESACMTRDIASALAFLHSLRIVHRDIKPENLLVYAEADGQRRIKLGDFGLAKIADGPLYTVCGTPTYVAPEILQELGYGLKVDIWALGVIVYVLLCGYPPFVSPSGDQEELFDLILNAAYDFPEADWSHISDDAKDLIVRMIDQDTDMRLSAHEVLEHPWLSNCPEDSRERRRKQQKNDLSYKVFEQMGLTCPLGVSSHS